VALRYRNPTSIWSEKQEHDEWWAKEIAGDLFGGQLQLGPNILLMGHVKTQMTATSPLEGYESISGPQSAIFGHPKIELKTVATPQSRLPKIITTTGAVTVKNYTDTKSGVKGEFHHSFGATIVEGDGDWFTLRQIVAKDDGTFIDSKWAVADGKVSDAPPAEAVALGDEHAWFVDPEVVKGTFGKGGLVPTLRPKRIFRHDVLDGFSIDHHHRGDPFKSLAKRRGDRFSARKEVQDTVNYILDTTPSSTESIVVASNHIDHLSRWIRETDWRNTDPDNMEFYLETALHMVRETKMKSQATSVPDPFYYWFEKLGIAADEQTPDGRKFTLLGRDESYNVMGVEFCFHGDKGANGAKGDRKAFSRIGTKTFIGHAHAPGITEGCYQVGTSSFLKLDYNAGLSGWMHCHGMLYANGKRSLIFFTGPRWCL
jgi:hypothetical protein